MNFNQTDYRHRPEVTRSPIYSPFCLVEYCPIIIFSIIPRLYLYRVTHQTQKALPETPSSSPYSCVNLMQFREIEKTIMFKVHFQGNGGGTITRLHYGFGMLGFSLS